MIRCNGHPAESTDRLCPTCGAQIEGEEAAMEWPTVHHPSTNSFCGSLRRATDRRHRRRTFSGVDQRPRNESFWEGEGFRASETFWDGESFWERLRNTKRRPTKVGLPDS